MDMLVGHLAIGGLWLLTVTGSGFNATLTAQTALVHSPSAAALTGLSITGALTIWCAAGYGCVALLTAVLPWLGWAYRLAGSLFLLFLGTRMVAETLLPGPPPVIQGFRTLSPVQAAALGFFANLADPMMPLAAASLFATLNHDSPDGSLGYGGLLTMALVTALWYLLIAGRCASPRGYARLCGLVTWLRRGSGLTLACVACQLLLL